MKAFEYSGIGEREKNEDYVVSKDFGNGISLYLVADGMGGYSYGEIASKTVGDGFLSAISMKKNLHDSVEVVSRNLLQVKKELGVPKIGSTVAGVYMEGMKATVFWAGDSRVYIYRNDSILYQTEDHSILNELQKKRYLTFEERERYGHIVTRSIMGEKDDRVDIYQINLEIGDELFICTDGIYNSCPVNYFIETLRNGCFDLDKHNQEFEDNYSLIYVRIE